MRNKVLVSVSVLAILALLLATGVSSARASENVTFLGSTFMYGKGLVIWFGLPDGYDPAGFEGAVVVDGVSYPLDCAVREDGVLACVADVSQKAIGSPATALFDGLSFDFVVHASRPLPVLFAGPWCYSVYDYGSQANSNNPPWGEVGNYCQDHPGQIGETILFLNPNYTGPDNYVWNVDNSLAQCGQGGGSPNFGPGYYYDC